LPQKGVVSYVFGKPSMTLWLPMLWQLNFFGCCKIGNWNPFLVVSQMSRNVFLCPSWQMC
jgi:hypothetical protein